MRDGNAASADGFDPLPTLRTFEYETVGTGSNRSSPIGGQSSSSSYFGRETPGIGGAGDGELAREGGEEVGAFVDGHEIVDARGSRSVDTETDGGGDGLVRVAVEPFEQPPLEVVVKRRPPVPATDKEAAVSGHERDGGGDAGVSGGESDDAEADVDFDRRRQSNSFDQLSAVGRRASSTVRNTVRPIPFLGGSSATGLETENV